MTQSTNAFIFDMDGTLIDNMPYHYQSWLEVFAEMGVPMTRERLRQNDRGTVDRIIRALLGEEITDDQITEIAERKEATYRQIYRPHMCLLPGLQRFLDQSRSMEVPLALATNARSGNVDYVLDGLALRAYFQVVIGDEDIRNGKPDPEIYLLTAARLRVPPQRCIVFEDSLPGIEAARRAGMPAVVLTTSLQPEEVRALPGVLKVESDFRNLDPETLAFYSPT